MHGAGNTRNSPATLSNWEPRRPSQPGGDGSKPTQSRLSRKPAANILSLAQESGQRSEVKTGRPTNLNLFSIKWPVTALVSITHRISGILLFLATALLLYLLDLSLASEEDFRRAGELLSAPAASFIVWLIVAALLYHLIAGCRHLLMDIGIGETWRTARFAAAAVIVLSVIGAILAGLWIW